MQIIFDHLAAVIIGGIVILILVAVNLRSRMVEVEATNHYALRAKQLVFVETVKRDMQNMTEVVSITEDSITGTFVFQALTDPDDSNPHQVTYQRVLVESRDSINLYHVNRLVDGVSDGGSSATITGWDIVARNEEGIQVADADDARQIYIFFEVVKPYAKDELDTIESSRWESTFRPPLIQQNLNI